MFKRSISLSIIVLSVLGAANAFAAGSGNVRLELPDAAAVGKGSAFVGEANRPSAVYYNPAGISQLGTEVSLGLTTLQPQIDYKSGAGNTVQMRRNTFVFPHIYFTTPLVKDKFYFGVGESSNWGSGNEWAEDSPATFTRYSMLRNEFENKDYMFVGAYKLNDQLSFGIGIDNDDSKINKEKKLFQATQSDANLQLKAKDNTWSYRLATMFKVNNRHQFGLMYRSPIHHKYEGKLYLDNLQHGASTTDYRTYFGDTSYETNVTTKFTLPQSVVLGYSFKPTNKWTFNFDLEWLDWSSVKRQAFNWVDETDPTRLAVLNTGNPQDRDWNSVWSQSLGVEYAATERLRLRGGYAHHQTPIPKETIDTSFPDSNSHSLTTGLGFDLTKQLTLDLAYVGAFYEAYKIDNNVDSVFGANLNGRYKEFVSIATATATYKF